MFFEGGVGVIAALVRGGRTVYTSDGATGLKWGTERAWHGQPIDAQLTIAVGLPGTDPDPIEVCRRSGDAAEIASYDGLDDAERNEFNGLAIERYVTGGILNEAATNRMHDLECRYYRISVFRGPAICAT